MVYCETALVILVVLTSLNGPTVSEFCQAGVSTSLNGLLLDRCCNAVVLLTCLNSSTVNECCQAVVMTSLNIYWETAVVMLGSEGSKWSDRWKVLSDSGHGCCQSVSLVSL